MKKTNITTLFILLFSLLLVGCSTIKEIPVKEIERVVNVYRDSLRIKDSIRVIPVERIVDIVPEYDTLKMETSLAASTSWVDTVTHTLKGKLENKKEAETKYIERIEYIEKIDTVYIQIPDPYPVEVEKTPKWAYYTLGICLILLVWLIAKIVLKFKKRLLI